MKLRNWWILIVFCFLLSCNAGKEYYPPPDSEGGWRTLNDERKIQKITGIDKSKLDDAFNFVRTTTKNGGLLVVRHGWLVYENYFGKGDREATPNLASCGKSFTSISIGILLSERPDKFPDGLEQKVYTTELMPSEAFPLPDPRMSKIKLGQLLAFTAGIRGNNPVYINGTPSKIDPVGPDGWYCGVDVYSLGREDGMMGKIPFTTKSLWCEPGGGYSYATSSIHNASVMLRHVTGGELKEFIKEHLALPMGWGRWGYANNNQPLVVHTPGGGGIALRSTDMLRFCYLLLHMGKWVNQQLVPGEYIQKATNAIIYNPHYPYSLQFNVNTGGEISELPRDAFWKFGSGGHCFCVIPSLDLIIWKLGGRDGQYETSNTGMPEPQYPQIIVEPINDGKVHDQDTDNNRTMIMVVNALTDTKNKLTVNK